MPMPMPVAGGQAAGARARRLRASGTALGRGERRRRPFDRDRIAVHRGRLPAEGDRERLAIDARFEQPVDGVDEVVAVELRVEAEDAAAEHPGEQLGAPRADRERLGIRPGNVPERQDRRVRQPLADHPRQQREVVVLHQHDRVARLRFLRRDRIGELLVDARDSAPSRSVRNVGPHMGDVAQRPEALVGEAEVIALLLFLRQPDPAHLVERDARAARRCGRCRSTVSRSAEPLPCAIQVPEHARITGSSAVTRPLAGRCTWMPAGVRMWM